MRFSRTLLTIIATGILSYACSATGGPTPETAAVTAKQAQSYTQKDYDAAVAAAKTAQKKASSVGGEWRDTASVLKKSEEAAQKGDFTKATQLANEAKLQGDAAYKQTLDQEHAGPRY